jgi:hypothetical protein
MIHIVPTRSAGDTAIRLEAPLVTEYDDLLRVFCRRRHDLQIPQLAFDWATGLQEGYTGKLECGIRNYGPISLGKTLRGLGLGLLVVPIGEPVDAARFKKPRVAA